jgi:hypothetical protein
MSRSPITTFIHPAHMERESLPSILKCDKLIVLDLDGVLVARCKTSLPRRNRDKMLVKDQNEILNMDGNVVVVRPGARAFLAEIMKYFRIAFWSSMTRDNMTHIIRFLLPYPEDVKRVEFTWDRQNTDYDPDYTGLHNSPVDRFDTVKIAERIVTNPCANKNRRWTMSNILIVEDSPRKVRFNPEKTSLFVATFFFPEDKYQLVGESGGTNVCYDIVQQMTKNKRQRTINDACTSRFETLEDLQKYLIDLTL